MRRFGASHRNRHDEVGDSKKAPGVRRSASVKRLSRQGDTFTISWTDHDGPPVSPPKQRGFGTIVLETMAGRSVDGAVGLKYATSGVTWRLTCPAAKALETWEREQISRQTQN